MSILYLSITVYFIMNILLLIRIFFVVHESDIYTKHQRYILDKDKKLVLLYFVIFLVGIFILILYGSKEDITSVVKNIFSINSYKRYGQKEILQK